MSEGLDEAFGCSEINDEFYDNLEETLRTLKKLRGTEVCPEDGWILMNI